MKTTLKTACVRRAALSALLLLVAGCASHAAEPTPSGTNVSAHDNRAALACTVSSNCVNSFDSSGLAPLKFEGTPAQAIAALRSTLADFPEAKIVRADDLSVDTVFTTTVGFKDLVDFKIDAQAQRIDYRSRSSFGLYDFGKNRSRMQAFSIRFDQIHKR